MVHVVTWSTTNESDVIPMTPTRCPECQRLLLDTPINEAYLDDHTWYCSKECYEIYDYDRNVRAAKVALWIMFLLIVAGSVVQSCLSG